MSDLPGVQRDLCVQVAASAEDASKCGSQTADTACADELAGAGALAACGAGCWMDLESGSEMAEQPLHGHGYRHMSFTLLT